MKSFRAYMDLSHNHRFDYGLAKHEICHEKHKKKHTTDRTPFQTE